MSELQQRKKSRAFYRVPSKEFEFNRETAEDAIEAFHNRDDTKSLQRIDAQINAIRQKQKEIIAEREAEIRTLEERLRFIRAQVELRENELRRDQLVGPKEGNGKNGSSSSSKTTIRRRSRRGRAEASENEDNKQNSNEADHVDEDEEPDVYDDEDEDDDEVATENGQLVGAPKTKLALLERKIYKTANACQDLELENMMLQDKLDQKNQELIRVLNEDVILDQAEVSGDVKLSTLLISRLLFSMGITLDGKVGEHESVTVYSQDATKATTIPLNKYPIEMVRNAIWDSF